VLTIDDPPERPVCSIHGALTWGYFTGTRQGARWASWTHETVPGLGAVLVPHVCDNPDAPPARWKPDPAIAERAARGNALARRVLAGEDPFTEKEAAHE
jgi:hypothetical protein